jgi:hypothetical protein
MFITAMAGNPLSVKLAADQGATITWIGWAVAAFVPGFLCLLAIPVTLLWLAPPEIVQTPDAPALAKRELATMGPMSSNEIITAAIFLGLLVLWVFGEQLKISATLAAAIGVCLMFVTRVLTWDDALNEKSAWDTVIWIGLLIMLAAKLNEYGMGLMVRKRVGRPSSGISPDRRLRARRDHIFLFPLLLCQCNRSYQRLVPALTRSDDCGWNTSVRRSDCAGEPKQHLRLLNTIRDWFRTSDVRSRIRHAGRVVEDRLHHERHLSGDLALHRPPVVDAAWARLAKLARESGLDGRVTPPCIGDFQSPVTGFMFSSW